MTSYVATPDSRFRVSTGEEMPQRQRRRHGRLVLTLAFALFPHATSAADFDFDDPSLGV